MTQYKIDARAGKSATPCVEGLSDIAASCRRPCVPVLRSGSTGWRAVLLGTVAAGALCIAAPRTATAGPDACTTVGNVVTCSGNQSAGIDAGPTGDFNPVPGTQLVVNNLTQDIIGFGVGGGEGIRWALGVAGTPINITTNTGSFAIRATSSGYNLADPGGDPVTLNHTGNIFAGASGISARSVGFDTGPTVAGTVSITMIGNIVSGGTGISATSEMQSGNGDASAVTVNFTGDITTNGSSAISADSVVSEGNGNAGAVTIESNGNFNGRINATSSVFGNGNSGIVDVSHQGQSGGISAQSLVGGNGNSGSVVVSNTGDIANGRINAQSIVDGVGDAAAVSITNAGNVTNSGLEIIIAAISQAKTDGDSGSVTVTSNGNLNGGGTGIVALSQAAGTGDAGGVVVSNTGNIFAARGISAASSVAAGDAGLVTVINTGNITASNQFGIDISSFAINGNTGPVRVESTGNISSANGGGILARSVANGGNAGTADVISTGDINARNNGILASSVANGAGTASAVKVTSTGNVIGGINGIFAQSQGGGGQGNIEVVINGGTVMGGTDAGVEISGGATNSLTIGANAAVSSVSGFAIVGGLGDETVNNSGVVTGNVLLGAGTDMFNNFAGALFSSGSIVELGGAGILTNAGTFAPGGIGAAPITTTLTGSFVQNAGGVFAVDVGNGTADRVNVSGTAALSGAVLPTIKGLVSASQQFTILSAAGGAANNGITVKDTLIFDYELLFPNANDMVLAVTANFTPGAGAGLTPNQRVTAAHLQSALGAGGGALGGLFGYLGNFADIASYATALDRLHAEPYLAPVKSVVLGGLGFTDSLMSCPTAASTGVNAYIAEGQCAWARMGGRVLNVDRTAANIGYEDKTWSASSGVQFALAPSWFGSAAAGYESSDIKVDNRASATGHIFHMGAGAKYISGNWQISSALTGGHARYDVIRRDVMPGVSAKGDQSLSFLSGRLRAAYVFGSENAYVKPLVDFDAVGILRGGILENGAGPVGLHVHRQTDALFSVAPAVEVGGQFAYADGTLVRPFARAGVRMFSDDELSATASFIGSPAGVPGFTVTTPLDRWMGELSAGLEVLSSDVYDARISYDGRYGENTVQHGGNVKLRAKF